MTPATALANRFPALVAEWDTTRNAKPAAHAAHRLVRIASERLVAMPARPRPSLASADRRPNADAGRRLPDLRSRDHFTVPGGVGGAWSLWMHDERSKSMNSSAFSCGESSVVLQPPGHAGPGVSPTPAETWRSL